MTLFTITITINMIAIIIVVVVVLVVLVVIIIIIMSHESNQGEKVRAHGLAGVASSRSSHEPQGGPQAQPLACPAYGRVRSGHQLRSGCGTPGQLGGVLVMGDRRCTNSNHIKCVFFG